MEKFRCPSFTKAIIPDFFDFLTNAWLNPEKFKVYEKEDNKLELVSVNKVNGLLYFIEFKIIQNTPYINISLIDEKYLVKETRYESEPKEILSSILMNERMLEHFKDVEKQSNGKYTKEDRINDKFNIYQVEELFDFFKYIDYQKGLENSYLLYQDIDKYGQSVLDIFNFLFSVYENKKFKNKLVLGDADYHYYKLDLPNKQIITYSNSASCLSDFYTFEKDLTTGRIRVFYDLVDNVQKKGFKFQYITIGKYPKIVQHYIENEVPVLIIENNIVTKNIQPNIIEHMFYINEGLSVYLDVDIPVNFDRTSYQEVLKYITIEDFNVLYSAILWSDDSKWKKGPNGYYVHFNHDMFHKEPKIKPMDFHDKGYISIFRKDSIIMTVPKDIAPDWVDFVKNGYEYVIKNSQNLLVCGLDEHEFKKVKNHLESVNLN